MLVSELADRADVPLATVKYYLREGLLPPGRVDRAAPRGVRRDATCAGCASCGRCARSAAPRSSALQVIVDARRGRLAAHPRPCSARSPTCSARPLPEDASGVRSCPHRGRGDRRRSAGAASAPTPGARRRLAAVVAAGRRRAARPSTRRSSATTPSWPTSCAGPRSPLVDPTKDRQGTLEDMVVGEAVFGEILTLLRRLGHEHYDEQRRRDAAADA